MNEFDFRQWSHKAADWSADYLEGIGDRPVRPRVTPGDIAAQIPPSPPETGQAMEEIFADFESLIPGAMTHWQHPRFFAYFPSNAAPAAMVAEQLVTTMAAQCMLWQTSPAATELEIAMVDWLRQAVGLPNGFKGVFQDTASSATLCAVLTMRERALEWTGNQTGLAGGKRLRIYASTRTHSSIDKAAWIAGIGQDNLVKIATDDSPGGTFAMDATALKQAVAEDRAAGHLPAGIIICVGGTSIGACDNVAEICAIAKEEGLYTHLDAAWAGSAMICPEFRHLWAGAEEADSIVLNPHKWLGSGIECSAHFLRDPAPLLNTMAIRPEYLKTYGQDEIVNFSEWSVQLGRRFRALKVWFLLRAYGLEGLRARIRNHVAWTVKLAERLAVEPDFEITTPPILSLFTFKYRPDAADNLDALNRRLIEAINDDGRIYLTQTDFEGSQVIRFSAGQFDTREADVDIAFDVITQVARGMGTG